MPDRRRPNVAVHVVLHTPARSGIGHGVVVDGQLMNGTITVFVARCTLRSRGSPSPEAEFVIEVLGNTIGVVVERRGQHADLSGGIRNGFQFDGVVGGDVLEAPNGGHVQKNRLFSK